MANGGLVVFGILIIVGMFFFTHIMISPQERSQMELANSACGSSLFGIPIGQIGQALSPNAAQACQQAGTYSQIASMEMPAYVIGFIILVIGLAVGSKKEVIREVVREKPSEKHETKDEEKEPKEEKIEVSKAEWEEMKKHKEKPENEDKETKSKVKYCSKCGTKVKGKFCSKCGEAV